MTDIVERLRGNSPNIFAMREAASEIERLRAALAQQPVDEPVAWRFKERINNEFDSNWTLTSYEPATTPRTVAIEPLYAAPQQRQPLDLDAIRQAIEERDATEAKYHDLAEHMVYRGNSVSWWHSKAIAYRDAIDKVWDELKTAGIVCDGRKTCADGVRELAAAPQQRGEPIAYGWRVREMTTEEAHNIGFAP